MSESSVFIVLVIAVLVWVVAWLAACALFASLSGWFGSVAAFPDNDEEPVLMIEHIKVAFWGRQNRLLVLSVCTSGLRVGMGWGLRPFHANFFVPWESLGTTPYTVVFWPAVELRFGNPVIGTQIIPIDVADRLAEAAGECWPKTPVGKNCERLPWPIDLPKC